MAMPTGEMKANAETVLIDVQVVARLLGCSARHVTRMRDVGLMPPGVKLGRLCKWPRRAIEEWVAAGCPPVRESGPTT
jgi:predicted DNA-binding transcriptional regulator AlpA